MRYSYIQSAQKLLLSALGILVTRCNENAARDSGGFRILFKPVKLGKKQIETWPIPTYALFEDFDDWQCDITGKRSRRRRIRDLVAAHGGAEAFEQAFEGVKKARTEKEAEKEEKMKKEEGGGAVFSAVSTKWGDV